MDSKFRCLTLILVCFALVGCAAEKIVGAGQSVPQPVGSWHPDFINIQPLSVRLLTSDGDDIGMGGEIQVFILLFPDNEALPPFEMHFPDNNDNYYRATVNQNIKLGLYGLSIDRRGLVNEVTLEVIVVDSNKLNPHVTAPISVIAQKLLGLNPYTNAIETVAEVLGKGLPDQALDWLQQNKILGIYKEKLYAGNEWMTGDPHTVEMKTEDGKVNADFIFQVFGSPDRAAPIPDSQNLPTPESPAQPESDPSNAIPLSALPNYVTVSVVSTYDNKGTIYLLRQGVLSEVSFGTTKMSIVNSPSIAPDSSKLAFIGINNHKTQLYVLDDNTMTGLAVEPGGTSSEISWFKDSFHIAYTLRSEKSEQTLEIANLDSSDFKDVFDKNIWDMNGDIVSPSWSNQGLLYIVRSKNQATKLQIRRSDGTAYFGMILSATSNTPLFYSKWSPTEGLISFVMSRREQHQNEIKVLEESLYLFDLNHEEAHPLVTMYSIKFPVWDPSGSQILFVGQATKDGPRSLYVYNVKETQLLKIESSPIDADQITGIDWGRLP